METHDRIYVSGHRGLVGSAICRRLEREGFTNLITASRAEVDLREQAAVESFVAETRPQYVFLAAARVGGIKANDNYPAEFLYENLMIEANIIHAAYKHNIQKLLFLGSTCIYPKLAPQPLKEEYLLTGPLEPTNEWYAVAKIAGIKLCQAYRKQYGCAFIAAMPTNLYGPGDTFELEDAHVLPALIRKFHEAKINRAPAVTVWGTGTPRREFLHVDDCADACLCLMRTYDTPEIVNIGVGNDISIRDLAELVQEVVGFEGKIVFDSSMPDGTPRKLVDVSKMSSLGWAARIALRYGVCTTYRWYVKHLEA